MNKKQKLNKTRNNKTSTTANNSNLKTRKAASQQNESSKLNLVAPEKSGVSLGAIRKLPKALIISLLVLIFLIFRLAWIQFVQGSWLKEQAYKQQTSNLTISPKRGTIYDTNGKALAISAQVDTVSVNPKKVKYEDNKDVEPEKLANILSTIFELNYEDVLTKITSDSSIVTIAEKVEKDKIDLLTNTLKENKITAGINIDSDTKRYYPYDNLASNLIGFFGTDKGLEGIEARWDSVLTGTSGKKIIATDSSSREIPNKDKTYIPAQNGSNITLTIDVNIQTIAEKYLKQAVTENSCARGGNVIIMEPSSGDILAMATYPDYNLNDPFSVDSSVWRNKAVSNTYEPGSTFKLINAAIALEEGVVDTDSKNFVCNGYEQFGSTKINCWRYFAPHGSQSLRESLENSCNPAFMQLGQKLGIQTLYKYYKAFGLFDNTGIALYGEADSIFHNINNVGPTELATMSFGQRFNITPLQLITAVSAMANDGVLMQPRIVKEIENTDTGVITTVDTKSVRQVISKETSLKMISMMESVVSEGTGQYGAVKGYTIGGKTGTSEPNPAKPEEGRTASYIAVAPVANPEVVILVTLYNPTSGSNQGSSAAGPVVSQILSEVLPYLGIPSSDTSATSSTASASTLVDVRNKSIAEAKRQLKGYGFDVKYTNTGENESKTLVIDQNPKPGVRLLEGSTICLYSENSNTRISSTVPNLKGKSLAEAKNILKARNLNIDFDGTRCCYNTITCC